jgi:hypothetical protein
MVVYDLDIRWTRCPTGPLKTEPPLLVDADTVLSLAITFPLNLPGIDNGYTGCSEMADIPRHHRHAMNERSRGDERIPTRARIGHMERCCSAGPQRYRSQKSAFKHLNAELVDLHGVIRVYSCICQWHIHKREEVS